MKLAPRLQPAVHRPSVIAVAAFAGAVVLTGTALFAFPALRSSGGEAPASPLVAEQPQVAPTQPPPPVVETPEPTPTVPPGPVPAARVSPGAPSRLTNPSSVGFPAPPPAVRTSAENAAGVTRIVSPDLQLDHHIETIGVVRGQMLSPDADGVYAVGWYAPDENYAFGMPGEEGNAVFSAHETWRRSQAPFYHLHKASIGDDIFLDMADGTRRHYQVIRINRYPAATAPMSEILWPSDRPANEEWITLYTCGGRIVYDGSGYGDYLERDVIVAAWVGNS